MKRFFAGAVLALCLAACAQTPAAREPYPAADLAEIPPAVSGFTEPAAPIEPEPAAAEPEPTAPEPPATGPEFAEAIFPEAVSGQSPALAGVAAINDNIPLPSLPKTPASAAPEPPAAAEAVPPEDAAAPAAALPSPGEQPPALPVSPPAAPPPAQPATPPSPPPVPAFVRPSEPLPPPEKVPERPVVEIPALPSKQYPLDGETAQYSRTVTVFTGQYVEIPFRGPGWVYLGEIGSRRGAAYDSRRIDDEGMVFVFHAAEEGTYSLKFNRQDFIRDFVMNDYVKVIVETAPRAPDRHGTA